MSNSEPHSISFGAKRAAFQSTSIGQKMPRTYVQCAFRETDTRTYTYHWDGEPLLPGEKVKIADKSGDGFQKVFVRSSSAQRPAFATKPILERYVEKPAGLDLGDDTVI